MDTSKNTKVIEKLINKTILDEYKWTPLSEIFMTDDDEYRNSQHLLSYRSYVKNNESHTDLTFYLLTYRGPLSFIRKSFIEELSLVLESNGKRMKLHIEDTSLLYSLRAAIEMRTPTDYLDSKLDDFLES